MCNINFKIIKKIADLTKSLPMPLPEAELLMIRGGTEPDPNPGTKPEKLSGNCGTTNAERCEKCTNCDKCIICI